MPLVSYLINWIFLHFTTHSCKHCQNDIDNSISHKYFLRQDRSWEIFLACEACSPGLQTQGWHLIRRCQESK